MQPVCQTLMPERLNTQICSCALTKQKEANSFLTRFVSDLVRTRPLGGSCAPMLIMVCCTKVVDKGIKCNEPELAGNHWHRRYHTPGYKHLLKDASDLRHRVRAWQEEQVAGVEDISRKRFMHTTNWVCSVEGGSEEALVKFNGVQQLHCVRCAHNNGHACAPD